MIRYNEFLVLLSGENLKNLKIKDNIRVNQASLSSDRVWPKNLRVFRVQFISGFGQENRVQNPKFLGRFLLEFQIRSIFDRYIDIDTHTYICVYVHRCSCVNYLCIFAYI